MACNSISPFFLIVLLFAVATPLAHGGLIGRINGLSVSGQLCCTSTGNCPGQGLVGVVVRLNCRRIAGVSTTLGQNTTDVNGSFNITVLRPQGLILGLPLIPCVVTVQLPLNATVCSALSTTNGVLVSAVRGVGTTVSGTLGRIQLATATDFSLRA
ncbi:hypothetical protein Pfo_029532 [Paulownia fortunei]|nr:hypothetical protein Pfo_003259 [Paulownia fortunei]KAI3472411.1 hypothetical protein Pfo_029532 [Paulownia fortunei]